MCKNQKLLAAELIELNKEYINKKCNDWHEENKEFIEFITQKMKEAATNGKISYTTKRILDDYDIHYLKQWAEFNGLKATVSSTGMVSVFNDMKLEYVITFYWGINNA